MSAAVGSISYKEFAGSGEPLAFILREIGYPAVATGLALAVVVGIPTVILAFMFGQSRIFFVMARDGLLPTSLARLNKKGAPALVTIATAIVCSVIAGLVPLADIAALANAGTLAAFIATSAAVMILRRAEPNRPRPFRTPLVFVVAPLAIAGCLYLFFSLQPVTQRLFFIWMAIGIPVYLLFGSWNSRLAKKS